MVTCKLLLNLGQNSNGNFQFSDTKDHFQTYASFYKSFGLQIFKWQTILNEFSYLSSNERSTKKLWVLQRLSNMVSVNKQGVPFVLSQSLVKRKKKALVGKSQCISLQDSFQGHIPSAFLFRFTLDRIRIELLVKGGSK